MAIKSRIEAIADDAREIGKKNGWLERKVVKANGATSISWPPKAEFREDYEGLILKMALAQEADPSGLTKASYNFGTALRERVGQISWEAMPGKTTGVLPGIFNAPLEQQVEYLKAMDAALRDEDGNDLIAKKLGLPVLSTAFGPSAWQMHVGAGAQTAVVISTERDAATNKLRVAAPARDMLNTYAAIRGLVLNQEAMVWHFPIFDSALKNANGVQLDFGRDPTQDEVVALYNAIHEVSGRDDWAPAYVPGVGVRVLNFSDVPNVEFHKLIDRAGHHEGVPDYVPTTFQSDGDYVSNDWEQHPDGAQYKEFIDGQESRLEARGTGRSDLQGWVEGELRPRAERVNQEFAEKYGWARLSPVRSGTGNESSPGSLRAPGYGTGQPGSVSLTGVHYSKAERNTLSGAYYGQGMKGAEKERLSRESASPEQRRRIHYYVNEGKGVRPESDVGGHAHLTTFNNLYDLKADPLDLWSEARDAYTDPVDRSNKMEQIIMERGFDGVYIPEAQGNQGVAVLLGGKHVSVPVQYAGTNYRGGDVAAQTTKASKAEETPADRVEKARNLPSGKMTGAEWKNMVPLAVKDADVSMLEDGQGYYKDQVAQAMRGRVVARMSAQRAANALRQYVKDNPGTLFRLPVADEAKNLEDIATQIAPDLKATDATRWDPRVDTMWRFSLDGVREGKRFANDAYISRKNDAVWVNLGGMDSGNEGGKVYQIAGAYAHNNGLMFIGDPDGITEAGKRRRLEAMISLALKYGKTDFIQPHRDMLGWNGMRWLPKVDNLPSMLQTSYNLVEKLYPEIKNVSFNFASGKFERGGAPVDASAFGRMASEIREQLGPDAAGAPGGGTLRQAALFKSLVSQEQDSSGLAESADAGEGRSAEIRASLLELKLSPARRQDFQWSEKTKTAKGGEILRNQDFAFLPVKRINQGESDFEDGGFAANRLMGHRAWVADNSQTWGYVVTDAKDNPVASIVMDVMDGKPLAVHDVEVYAKGNGVGARMIASLAANTDGQVQVIDILDQSQRFWEALGAHKDFNGNGQLDWQTASAELDRRSQRDPQQAVGSSQDAGSDQREGLRSREEADGAITLFSPARHALSDGSPAGSLLDAGRLTALRRAAARLEQPEKGLFLRVEPEGVAIATGQKGQRIPQSFIAFARQNDLTLKAYRDGGRSDHTSLYSDGYVTPKSSPMPVEYRESGARYYAEGNYLYDRTGMARFSPSRKQTESPEFKAWFGEDSTLINEDGTPMVLYHGTNAAIATFKPSKTGAMGAAVYLGDSPEVAESYADGAGANVMPVYARGRSIARRSTCLTAMAASTQSWIAVPMGSRAVRTRSVHSTSTPWKTIW